MVDGKLVFVSYSHKDRKFLDEEVLPFLKQLELGDQIELWDDRMIGVGEDWYAEIADRIDQARVAILVVTENFLASGFCLHEEVPVLLQRARRGELHLLPLHADPCFWENERWLKPKQMFPGGQKALSQHKKPARRAAMTEFAKKVLAGVEGPPPKVADERRFDAPHPTHDLHRMPFTGSLLFGRRKELKLLDDAWDSGQTNVVAFTAGGGVGKSTLARVWTEMLAEDGWRGAERVYAWSFYSQGTGRMTDAETFLNEALKCLGATDWEGRSIWERAERLAERIRRQKTLLILDGVEPLQAGKGEADRGSVRDPGLRTLLEELAKENNGLCIVTTREQLADLDDADELAVLHRDLDQVSRLAGRALLRVERVRGEDAELEAAVGDLGDHALAVSLLGKLLKDGGGTPHISGASALPTLEHDAAEGGHPRRVLEAWATRLGDGAELELLHLVGLFDRPAELAAVQAVIDGGKSIGLTKRLGKADLDTVVERLREARLLAGASRHDDALDTHPIVREHFGARLKARHPKSWTEGHRRLYEHYKDVAEFQPDDLVGMQPLFAAVVHGCAAGLHQEACEEIYIARILRGSEFYCTNKLGAFAANLSCLSHFFAECWGRPEAGLTPSACNWLVGEAGSSLRALGRLHEAQGPMAEGFHLDVGAEEWTNAAIMAGNLSGLYLMRGDLPSAEVRALEAIAHADKCGDWEQPMIQRTTCAHVLHQCGRAPEAQALFVEAERMQAERQPVYPRLYALQGYRYCDFLIAMGKADEVLRRANLFFDWRIPDDSLLTVALDHLITGRAYLAMSPPSLAAAEPHLRAAVDGLRSSGTTEHVPTGLLARATYHRLADDLPRARKDLDAAATLIRRHGLRLFEADLALERTRCHLDADDKPAARETLATARELVDSMNYGRRLPEIAELEAKLGVDGTTKEAAE